MGAKARSAWVFALCAAAGLAGQTLLVVERHCSRLEESLRGDFRVVLFLRPRLDEGKAKVLEEKLRSQPEVGDVKWVAADDAFAALKKDDPELAESVALVSDNPLPDAFEVTPAPEALSRLGAWLDGVSRLADWSDLRWKQGQLQAILRLRFYARFLRMTLSTLLCVAAALALAALLTAGGRTAHTGRLTAAAGLGGAFGAALAALIAWPLRRDELLWAAPSLLSEAAVVAVCASLGWSLSSWKAES